MLGPVVRRVAGCTDVGVDAASAMPVTPAALGDAELDDAEPGDAEPVAAGLLAAMPQTSQ